MRKTFEASAYEYTDRLGETQRCGRRVFSDDVVTVVIASALDGAPGRDLRTTRELLIPAAVAGLAIPVDRLVWIEHHSDTVTHGMAVPEAPDRYNTVKFTVEADGRFGDFRTDLDLGAAEVSRLIGEILPATTR